MVTKEPKTLRGKLRKTETGDGRKSTAVEKTLKQVEKTQKQVDKSLKDTMKWTMTGKSTKKKK